MVAEQSAREALAELSYLPVDGVDDVVDGWSRRRFLKTVMTGLAGGALISSIESVVPLSVREAFAGGPLGANEKILMLLMMYGGNDGLNTVIPYTDPAYRSLRPSVAVADSDVLPLDDRNAFHPRLRFLKTMYDTGDVAVVHGVGYPDPDLSHFVSMGVWMTGRFGGVATPSGWVGRWLDDLDPQRDALAAATIGTSVPLHLSGLKRRAVALAPTGIGFGAETGPTNELMYQAVRDMAKPSSRGALHDMFASTFAAHLDVVSATKSAYAAAPSSNSIGAKMALAARLVNADIGLRLVDVPLEDFDTHAGQVYRHGELLGTIDDAIAGFFNALDPRFKDRVVLMTVSEFGRTPRANSSGGTDHGTAAPMLIIGPSVNGGVYGSQPSLTALDRYGRMRADIDFRSVIGSAMTSVLGADGQSLVGGSFADLGMFGSSTPSVPSTPANPVGFVPLDPYRVVDTRDGTGVQAGPLGAGSTLTFTLAGVGGVPAAPAAVVLNVTAVGASAQSFLTLYPAGASRPSVSNLNPMPGRTRPNMVVVSPGFGGAVSLFNASGQVDVVVDVLGFFAPDGARFMSVTPDRLLDTRDGTRLGDGMVGAGESVLLPVAGRSGVPADATAVVVNVTATASTASSFITVHPSGSSRPLASTLNLAPGSTVANTTIAKLGPDGKLLLYNNTGRTHLIVDVLGAFSPSASGLFVALPASRALDTRDGTGAPRGRVDARGLAVRFAGRSGVPTSGVSAVLVNMTGVEPDASTFVVAYASGANMPPSSNLNLAPRDVVPNMAVIPLGVDGAGRVFNSSGSTDVVIDVLGYFTA